MNDEKMLAHLKRDENNIVKSQTIKEHSFNVAYRTANKLKKLNLYNIGMVVGLLHDMGKCSNDFQNYVKNGGTRGSVIHTFQGLKYVCENLGDNGSLYEMIARDICAYAIGAHHGLFDCYDEDGISGFSYRIEKKEINYNECLINYFNEVISEKEIYNYFCKAVVEIKNTFTQINKLSEKNDMECNQMEIYFYLGVLVRLILSALIDSDHKDTACFMEDTTIGEYKVSSSVWNEISKSVESKIELFKDDSKINQARKIISNICKDASNKETSIYTLNVPTGAGKTISSLRYAVNHAKKYKKDHIIFVSPLLSILDQNAKVIKNYIGNDDYVLEHHSNVIHEKEKNEEISKYDILTQSWDSPVIITTFVQLLNNMFARKSGNLKRFYSLCNSVIVIDEIQSLPTKLTSMFNLMCNFLSKICNTDIVLCSATQPPLDICNHAIVGPIQEIVPYSEAIWKPFKRTKIEDLGNHTVEELEDIILERLKIKNSILLICNTKKEAITLFEKLKEKSISDLNLFHLSANMCMKHRKDTLARINKSLYGKKKTIVISTQVIEAGVDISFQSVIRLYAGMDNVVQAAGRCNRNGEVAEVAEVDIVNLTGESLKYLKEIEKAKESTLGLISDYNKQPDKYDRSLESEKSIEKYYKNFYGLCSGQLDYPRKSPSGGSLLDLLTINSQYAVKNELSGNNNQILKQAFKMAADEFEIFDQNTKEVIVLYKESEELIEQLKQESNMVNLQMIINKLKPFSVSVRDFQLKNLKDNNAIVEMLEGLIYVVEDKRFYDSEIGLQIDVDEKLDLLEV